MSVLANGTNVTAYEHELELLHYLKTSAIKNCS